jgi:hypothetical protein
MLREIFLLLIVSNPIYAVLNPTEFGLICISAVALAFGLWWLCNKFTGLWNRSFYLSWLHHVACAIAALCTVFVFITFASVGEIGHVFDRAVDEWGAQMHVASENSLGLPTPSGDPSPQIGSDVQPMASDSELVHRFEAAHPFLHEVLHSRPEGFDEDPRQLDQGSTSSQTIDRVASGLKDALQEQVHRVIIQLRSILFLSFLLVQGIAFGVTGYAAHRNIRPC